MIRFTSITRSNITHEQHVEVSLRALSLGCDVSVIWLKPRTHGRSVGRYTATARKAGSAAGWKVERGGYSSVYEAISAALDAYEHGQSWTADELLTIAAQSGLEVARA